MADDASGTGGERGLELTAETYTEAERQAMAVAVEIYRRLQSAAEPGQVPGCSSSKADPS